MKRKYLFSWCFASLSTLTLSIFLMAFSVFSARFLSYLSGLFLFLSNSNVESWRGRCNTSYKTNRKLPSLTRIKLSGRFFYLCHILSTQPPVRLSPLHLARISLHFKVLVAFRSTKSKNLEKTGCQKIELSIVDNAKASMAKQLLNTNQYLSSKNRTTISCVTLGQ